MSLVSVSVSIFCLCLCFSRRFNCLMCTIIVTKVARGGSCTRLSRSFFVRPPVRSLARLDLARLTYRNRDIPGLDALRLSAVGTGETNTRGSIFE